YFHITTQQFSIIVSAYSYSAFASGIIAAFIVDNFDRKKVLLIGYTGFIIGTILCGLAPGYTLLISARIMAGLFGGLIGAQVLSIVADTIGYEKRGRAMGYLMASFSIASVIGVPFSLYLSNIFSWHAPFILTGILGLIIIPMVWRFLPSMTQHISQSEKRIKVGETLITIFSRPESLAALALSAFLMLGHFLIIPFMNPYMEFNVGFTKQEIPLIYMVGGAATLFSAPLFGKMADKYGKLRIFTLCTILSLPFIFMITNMPSIEFYLVLIVTAIWFVVANGRGIASQAMISNAVEPEFRGSFMSFNSSFQQLFIGSASFFAGLIVTNDASKKIHHYQWVGYLSIAVIAGCILLGKLLGRYQKVI
ncbi:MAG: MFS transporter, partial [Bacteroidota bacterium]|nr:MFS transporter [Bacteroidota bacterium]